jgi:hypothetical protein
LGSNPAAGLGLDQTSAQLARYLRTHPGHHLSELSYSLAVGQKQFEWRRAVTCSSREDHGLTTISPLDVRKGRNGKFLRFGPWTLMFWLKEKGAC